MYLLDTDTLIYALKGVEKVVANFRRHAGRPLALSVVSYGELVYGAFKSAHPAENLAKVRRIAELYPLVEVSRGVMDTFGQLKAELEVAGQRLDDFDVLIASTAIMLGYVLVTNNERHYRRVPGLVVENWSRQSCT
jgi:tRNA(fMet)-specific endonuclease VapC